MDFFNSLSQVAKNRNNFKKWEDNQRHENAQREELAKRRNYTPEQLQQAKEFGSTIIDVVDVMDNHSESVAENVETAVDPLSSIATMLAFFGGNYLVFQGFSKKQADAMSNFRNSIIDSDEYAKLEKKVNQYHSKNSKGEGYYRYSILNKKELKLIKDPDLRKELSILQTKYNNGSKKYIMNMIKAHGLMALASIGVFIASTMYEAKLQTDSSKIARYQARKELDDPKAFVTYTPEQIAKAKKELEEHPELIKKEKKSKLKTGMFSSIYNIIKDKKAYSQDKAARTDDSQKVNRQLTKEELIQAEKDKEVIQRTVRIINNEAEKNSENMEAAANVIMTATPILGATLGAATGWVLNKMNTFGKFIQKTVDKEGTEETKQLYNELKASKKTGWAYFRQWGEFADSLMNSKAYEEARKLGKTANKKGTADGFLSKLFAAGFAHKTGQKWGLGFIGGMVTSFAGMIIGLKLQKSAARAGRFTAKRELEKNPENFIGYSQDDYNEVKNIKNTKKKENIIKEYALFIPRVLKQYYDYNKYKKHEFKEKQALREILKKEDVTPEQMRDAKNLQRKLFNTFEKVDDNSQIYSESMEAATEIAQPFVTYGGMLLAVSPVIYTGVQVARGKITTAKLLDKIVSKLSSSSNIMKKNWFKKYLGHVEQNVSNVVNNIDTKVDIDGKKIDFKPLGAILKDIDLKKDPAIDVITKAIKNSFNGIENITKMSNEEQMTNLSILENKIKAIYEKAGNIDTRRITNLFNTLKYGCKTKDGWVDMTPKLRADIINAFANPEKVNPENFDKLYAVLSKLIGEEEAGTVLLLGPKANQLKNIAKDGIKGLQEQLNTLKASIMERASQTNNVVPLNKNTITLLKKILGEEEFNACFKGSINNINDFLNPPKGIVKAGETSKLVAVFPDEVLNAIDASYKKLRKATFSDLRKLLPDSIVNPSAGLNSFKAKIEKMSEAEFEDFVTFKIKIPSMKKEMLLEMIPKIEKIINNLPKSELEKIQAKMLEEFNKNPDAFMKLIETGKIKSIFMTPQLEKALTVAGISWTVFSFAMAYVIQAWLANMQLKAGRLGVMKAMESLDDPAYYANIEPTKNTVQTVQTKTSTTVSSTNENTNLLEKLKKNS